MAYKELLYLLIYHTKYNKATLNIFPVSCPPLNYSGVGSKIKVERPIVLVDSSGNVILKWGADYAEPDEIDPIVCEAHNRTCEAWSP